MGPLLARFMLGVRARATDKDFGLRCFGVSGLEGSETELSLELKGC